MKRQGGDVTDAQTLMDRIYGRERYIYDATRRFTLYGRDLLLARLKPEPGNHVLEIACGTGRNLIVEAGKYSHADFFGLDVSTEMLKSAKKSIGRAAVSSRIRIAHADATTADIRSLFG